MPYSGDGDKLVRRGGPVQPEQGLVLYGPEHDDPDGETVVDGLHVNFVALAGYLRKIPAAVVAHYKNRMLNIHPALLPAFGGKGYYGRRVHEAVIEHGVQWSGATVHLVDEQYDTGPIVVQRPVRVEPDDTPETLAARILKVEHEIYPEAIGLFAEGRVRIEGRRIRSLE